MNKQTLGRDRSICRRTGFTLTEMLIASAISVMVITGLVKLFTTQREALNAMQQINDVSQSVRVALDAVVVDLRNAGYGGPIISNYAGWFTWAAVTGPVTVIQGNSGASDILHIVAAMDAPTSTLASAATKGATTITLQSGHGAYLNTTTKRVIYIGKTETARITAINGDVLTISTDPGMSKGLLFSHASGAPIELVKVQTYSWGEGSSSYPYTQYLKRWDNYTSYDAEWKKMVAGNISDFQIEAVSHKDFRITLTGKASSPDRAYRDPTYGDKYRRIAYSVDAYSRRP